jgi:hypothetical protein
VAGGAVATGGVVAGPAAAALVASGLTGYADDELTSGTWDLGPIGSRTIGSQLLCLTSGGLGGTTMKVDPTCSAPGDAKGDWVIRYHVTEGAAIPAVLTDGAYWKPLLDDRNGGFTTPVAKSVSAAGSSSGVLPVPGSTEPALVSTYHGRLLGRPLRHEGITMLTEDWHTFTFDLSDLGKVSTPRPPGPTSAW